MRITLLLVALSLGACAKGDAKACTIPEGRVQATSENDRARWQQQSPPMTAAQYDTFARTNCYSVPR